MNGIPPLALTPGEPAGIGPEIVLRAARVARAEGPALVAIADPGLLQRTSRRLDLAVELIDWSGEDQPLPPGQLYVQGCDLAGREDPGRLDPDNAAYVLDTLKTAAQGCLDGQFSGMVTAPVHKGIINDAGHAFSGHTELLAEIAGTDRVVMMLATRTLRVALATTHLPLRKVPDTITTDLLIEVIGILHQDLELRFGLSRPRILVCGLNPHAGESGHLGHEDEQIISPAVAHWQNKGVAARGPLPADTAFTQPQLEQADAVLAMYHDQGLPVLKYAGFGKAINITLGLPFVRTSVDHGTALDIARQGGASETSLLEAIRQASRMVFQGGSREKVRPEPEIGSAGDEQALK